MIKIDGSNVQIRGSADENIGEAALMLHAVCKEASERVGVPYEEIMGLVTTHVSLYPLIDSGMGIVEAMNVIGVDPQFLNIKKSDMGDTISEEEIEEIKKIQKEKGIGDGN